MRQPFTPALVHEGAIAIRDLLQRPRRLLW
jgi:hypothetical protein